MVDYEENIIKAPIVIDTVSGQHTLFKDVVKYTQTYSAHYNIWLILFLILISRCSC